MDGGWRWWRLLLWTVAALLLLYVFQQAPRW